jgi:hypothetical protein
MDTAYIQASGTTKTLSLIGRTADGQQNFRLNLFAIDSFTVGTYKASLSQTDFQYFAQGKNIYQADQFIGEFIVVVTALGNNQITGTFSGTSKDSTGAIKQLTLGKFTSRINLSGNGTGGGGGGTAVGTLGASAGTCMPVTNTGTYKQGMALTSGNTVTVTVTVATPGTYTIATNTVNGVTFLKTGTFTTTGVQTVTLDGTGMPLNSGSQNFTVTFGSSTCSFPINFEAGTPPPVSDYFPTSAGSFWNYVKTTTPKDSFKISATAAIKTITGQDYNVFTYNDLPTGAPFELYYRKGSGIYYENINTEDFFGFDTPGNPADVEYMFLKDNVPAGNTWNSPTITGIISGTTYTFTIKMTLFEKVTTPTTIGSVVSSDILKVKYEYTASC